MHHPPTPLTSVPPSSAGHRAGVGRVGVGRALRTAGRWTRRAALAGMTGLAISALFWTPEAVQPVNDKLASTAGSRGGAAGAGGATRPAGGIRAGGARAAGAATGTRPAGARRPSPVRVLSEDADGRVVRDAAGTVRVPLHPQRVIALAYVDELVALGVKPFAVVSGRSYALVPDYLTEQLRGARELPYGHLYDPLPAYDYVAEFEPDLIVAQVSDRHTYDQFSALAPTIVLRDASMSGDNQDLDALRVRLLDMGKVFGREAEAKAYIAAFDAKLAEAKRTLGPKLAGKTAAVFRTRWQRWLLYGQRDTLSTGPAAIFNALDIKAPAAGNGLARPLDLDDLIGMDPDYVIVAADDTIGAPQELARLTAGPLWKRLRAVREGRVLQTVACNHWLDSGLVGKGLILDDLARVVQLGEQPLPNAAPRRAALAPSPGTPGEGWGGAQSGVRVKDEGGKMIEDRGAMASTRSPYFKRPPSSFATGPLPSPPPEYRGREQSPAQAEPAHAARTQREAHVAQR